MKATIRSDAATRVRVRLAGGPRPLREWSAGRAQVQRAGNESGGRHQEADRRAGRGRADNGALAPRRSPRRWQTALPFARLPLYDVHWIRPSCWTRARMGHARRPDRRPHVAAEHSGLGRERRSSCMTWSMSASPKAAPTRTARPRGARAELRVRPQVQGAALVLENKTGRILAMAGAFSLSAEPAQSRQPGRTLSRARRSSRWSIWRRCAAACSRTRCSTIRRSRLPPVDGGILCRCAKRTILDAEELRRRWRRHSDHAPRAGR